MNNKKLRFSVNPDLIDKFAPGNKQTFSTGFRSVEFSIEELSEVINMGMAISYQYTDEIRKAGNFQATDFLAVDVDSGLTITEALAFPVVKDYCSLFYTTPSHTPDRPRFRLIFSLPRTITEVGELVAAAKSLTKRLGGDIAATDGARIFYGSSQSSPAVYDKSISIEFLAELITDGKLSPSSESVAYKGSTANRSDLQLEPNFIIKSSIGEYIEVRKVETNLSIYCPFHDDRNPSAFTSRTPKKSIYIHCPKCQTTWWMKGAVNSAYDFDSFDRTVREIKSGSLRDTEVERFFDTVHSEAAEMSPSNIHITNTEFISVLEIEDGITFIKSPKGSGKTTFLAKVLTTITEGYATLESYEEDCDADSDMPIYSKDKILLIGHRQALIGDLCNRLKLNCYLDEGRKDIEQSGDQRRRFGICLDSLNKIYESRYDVVVIDEVEQVLSHFLSETIGEKRRRIFDIFSNLVRTAKKIVVLDADLGWISFNTLVSLRESRSLQQSRNTKKRHVSTQGRAYIYINEWKPDNRSLSMYPTVFQLIQDIKSKVSGGKRVFVTSNSKAKIKALEKAIEDLGKDNDQAISMITITSENSREKGVQGFIKNIKTEILKYQVILSSPSLGTGIDITFKNSDREIDCVYGIFENQINTHFEIDQQLARVRHPGEIMVWISSAKFSFETEFGVACQDYLQKSLVDSISWDLRSGQSGHPNEVPPFLHMAAMVTSHQRASKNNLKANFIKYKISQGWTIKYVSDDEMLNIEGSKFYQIGKEIGLKEWIKNILVAKIMNVVQFDDFQDKLQSNNSEYTEKEWFSYYRTNFELFYGEPATDALIIRDNKGTFRRNIKLFEQLLEMGSSDSIYSISPPIPESKIRRKIERMEVGIFKTRQHKNKLLYGLLSTTPIFKGGIFNPAIIFNVDQLVKFSELSIQMKHFVSTQLGINTQADVDKKPIQHLGKLLKLVGLELEKSKVTNVNNVRTYHYAINPIKLNEILVIVGKRPKSTDAKWDYINEHYKLELSVIDDCDLLLAERC